MKVKDLMIGCLYRVKKDVCLPKGTIVIIRGIDADNCFPERHLIGSATCLPVNSEDGFTYGVWVEYLEPIPLTTEILEKNGFKLNPQGSYSIGRNVSIDILDGHYNANINTDNPQIPSFLYLVGSYVHELQQALRLCKIEKEIIL